MAISKLTHVTIVVANQDEALAWYQDKFGFEVVTDDSETIPGSRWLTVKPQGQEGLEIILFPPMKIMRRPGLARVLYGCWRLMIATRPVRSWRPKG